MKQLPVFNFESFSFLFLESDCGRMQPFHICIFLIADLEVMRQLEAMTNDLKEQLEEKQEIL